MAAPASAAPMALSAIWPGVTGRWGDMLGVWIDPVIAQVMMTLRDAFIESPFGVPPLGGRRPAPSGPPLYPGGSVRVRGDRASGTIRLRPLTPSLSTGGRVQRSECRISIH